MIVMTPYTSFSCQIHLYDGLGRRVAKRVNGVVTKYMYDQEDILLQTDVSDSIIARYTHGPGIDEPISMDRDGSSYYYIADALGSIIKVLDAEGNVINRYVYNSFGSIVDKAETVPNPYTYTGREYDAESGLYYYRARYYDAKTGRFLSEDPIGFITKEANLFHYVRNNPINWWDPWGLRVIYNGHYVSDPATREKLEKLDQAVEGDVYVTEGDRTPDANYGAPNSYHKQGKAADVYVLRLTSEQVAEKAAEVSFDGISTYDKTHGGHTHLDTRGYEWNGHNGKTIPRPLWRKPKKRCP